MPYHRSILMALPPTRFSGARRPAAIAILLATLAAVAVLMTVALGYRPPLAAPAPDKGDLAMYARVADEMRAGKDYYATAHAELLANDYGTRSVFNWRLPALPWLASRLPSSRWADTAFRIVALAAGLAAAAAIATGFGLDTALLAAAALAVNLVSAAAPDSAVFTDIVAGVLILAAVATYGLGRPLAGVAIALLALFMRELVAPAVLVFIVLAWRERRYRELIAWAFGLAVFAGYFAWHWASVRAQLGPADVAYPSGWVQFGGLRFILATAGFNGFFIASALWQTAILLPLALLGLAAWKDEVATRVSLTVAVYLPLFAVVGKPFNDYWGALYTPLMMLGLAFMPAALRDLVLALGRKQAARR